MGVKATARLEKLFDHAQPAIKLFQGLTEKVEDGPFAREEKLSLTRETIGGLPISFSGRAIASAAIHPVNQAVSIFEFGAPPSAAPQPPEGLPALPGSEEHSEPAKPPRGQAYTELGLFLGAEISAATNAISNQTLTLALAAAASGSVSYRLLLPAESGATKLEAGARLLVRARPPHRLDLRKLEKGELHTFDSRMLLGFAVSVKAGEELEIAKTLELFDDVSLALRAHATATLEASFGLALYDRLQLAVGRANVAAGEEWVRVRVQRLRRRELTLGAKLDLQVKYNLGKETFTALFDRILEIEPVTRLFGAIDEIEKAGLHQIDDAEAWEEIRGKLSKRVQELVLDYVDPEALLDELPFERIEPFLADIAKLVERYRDLDAKVLSLVETTLGRVGLGKGSELRGALERVAALPTDVDELLAAVASPELRDAIALFELLGGTTVEELTLGARAEQVSTRARKLAQEAIDLLEGLGEDALERMHEFTRRSGVDSVIDWLETNAKSTAALKKSLAEKATARIEHVVGRLVGKALDELDEDDLQRIAEWGRKLVALSKKRAEFEERVGAAISKLEGEMGFSVGIEISRLTEQAAVLDLELDPRQKSVREVVERSLSSLSARSLLEELEDPGEKEPGYRIRDSVFSHRRVRTSAMASFFSLLGLNRKRKTVRIDEEVVRVSSHDGGVERRATYSSGAVRSLEGGETDAAGLHEAGLWVTHRAHGTGVSLNGRYESVDDPELVLFYTRKDGKTDAEELAGLETLMRDLGFRGSEADAKLRGFIDSQAKLQTEYTFAIRGGAELVDAILDEDDADLWALDYRNASHRWLDEPLFSEVIADGAPPRPRRGKVLAALLSHPTFEAGWRQGVTMFAAMTNVPWNVTVDGRDYRILMKTKPGETVVLQKPINTVVGHILGSTTQLEEAVELRRAALAENDHRPDTLRRFGKKNATLWARTPFGSWPSPLFNVWLVVARCARRNPGALGSIRGLATLKVAVDGGDELQILRWTLKGLSSGAHVFPFSGP